MFIFDGWFLSYRHDERSTMALVVARKHIQTPPGERVEISGTAAITSLSRQTIQY